VLDLAHLAGQTAGDLSLERELLDLFRTRAPELVETMRLLAEASQSSAVCDLAHQLRGSSLALGAQSVAAAAETVEQLFDPAARSRNGEAAAIAARDRRALAALSDAVAQALLAIDAYLHEGPTA
jgi:HPt (histidine-containing phosphotransfer) domain-containing protein